MIILMDNTFAALILNPSVMKALILILCCLALALVLSAIEKLRVLKISDKIKQHDPQQLKESLREYSERID
jgi:Mg2+/citrate symporter